MRTAYCAGPMTGYPEFNFAAFDDAATRLRLDGWHVLNPADLDRDDGFDPTGKTGLEPIPESMRQRFARNDIGALLEADTVFMLPGWEQSTGATHEYEIAGWLGLDIRHYPTGVPIVPGSSWAGKPTAGDRVMPPPIDEPRTFTTGTGQRLTNIHDPANCDGEACVIHNPSDHDMRDFPTNWRDEGFMERMCPHGVGHPDPDDSKADPVHGCDGCCGVAWSGLFDDDEPSEWETLIDNERAAEQRLTAEPLNARADLLAEAERLVNGDRNVQYGDPQADFRRTAEMWGAYLQITIDPHDVAALMALLKLSRISWAPGKRDSWADLAGYAACGWDTASHLEGPG